MLAAGNNGRNRSRGCNWILGRHMRAEDVDEFVADGKIENRCIGLICLCILCIEATL